MDSPFLKMSPMCCQVLRFSGRVGVKPCSGMNSASTRAVARDQHAAGHDRHVHSDIPQRDGKQHPDQSTGQVVAVGMQEGAVGVLLADLVGEPGLLRPAGEGVADAPEYLRQHNRQEGRERPSTMKPQPMMKKPIMIESRRE